MEVSYATMIAMGTLVQRLGRDAQRYQAALAEAVNESAEWKRIADELKAERDAAKQEAASARQDAVTRAEADRKRIDGLLMIQAQDMRAEIERLKKPRQHPVKVGEYVKNDNGDVCQVHEVYAEYLLNTGWTWAFENCAPCDPPEATHITPEGKAVAESAAEDIRVGDMVEVFQKTSGETLFDDVSIRGTVAEVFWAETGNKCVRLDSSTMNRRSLGGSYFAYCDVRKIAKETAQAAVTPQPGDVVRLVRVPTMEEYADWDDEFGGVGSLGVVKSLARQVANVKYNDFTWEWPISCIEIVEDAK